MRSRVATPETCVYRAPHVSCLDWSLDKRLMR